MTAVNLVDAITYGFRLMGYFLAFGLVGAIVAGLGSAIVGAGTPSLYGTGGDPVLMLFGVFVTLLGVAFIYAGVLGTGDMVIPDAVEEGLLTAK